MYSVYELVSVPVSELREGDLIDLEDDAFADPDGDNPVFKMELIEVVGGELENKGCYRLDYDGGACGFPPEYRVRKAVFREVELDRRPS